MPGLREAIQAGASSAGDETAVTALQQLERTAAALATRKPRRGRQSEPARPAALPQHCPPPLHVPAPPAARKADCERVAKASHARAHAGDAGRRELVYWAPWVRPWFRRGVQTQEQAGRELGKLPEWWRARVRPTAEHYGGIATANGRTVVMFCALVYWHARSGRTAISGLSQAAWASLTVGTRRGRRHYGREYLFHRVHDMEGPLEEDKFGPEGGRVGAGSNCGLVAVLERDGLITLFQPDGRVELPAWLVGPKGWAFCQVIARLPVNEPASSPHDEEPVPELAALVRGPPS